MYPHLGLSADVRGPRTLLDGNVTEKSLRPHRDDVFLAVVSTAAGLAFWSLGVYSSPGRGFLPAWAALVPSWPSARWSCCAAPSRI